MPIRSRTTQKLARPRVVARRFAATLAVSFVAAPALAQTVLRAPGPDVIVGELPDTVSYGTQGSTNIFAYDLGTESCNAGSSNLSWIAETNQHPVIAQHVYRIKDGRFEQIGLSWVKHGFAALAGNQCNFGCSGVSGTVLGVGCSDPYTFGLNGSQFGLGPRSEINAASGAFPYPFTSPAYSGVLARRIQINAADIDPALNPGAQYVAEGIYITPDDAAAGNGWNNASYRFMSFGSDAQRTSSFVPGSATRRTRAAIYAWQEVDPTVSVRQIDIPGDGVLLVGQKVLQLSPTLWRYEIAVQNLTSDRSVGAVEIGASATPVTSTGFSGVAYHSGDPFDSTPWSATQLASSVRFSTQTFAQNPNANALRWGTAYAFRFDSPDAPGSGSLRLHLFKPGAGPAAAINFIDVPALTPGAVSMPTVPPPGDACSSVFAAHAGVNGFTTLGATSSGPDTCLESSSAAIDADVWYRYTFPGPCSGPMTIATCGSSFDTKIAVYPGAACPAGLGTLLACNDDAPQCLGGSSGGAGSSVTLNAIAGATYLIRVGSRTGETGHVLLTIAPPSCAPPAGACCFAQGGCQVVGGSTACATFGGVWQGDLSTCSPNPCPQPPRPPNDDCADALPIGDVLAGSPLVSGNNLNALTDPAPECESGSRDVWYRYVPAVSASITVDTCDTPAVGFNDTVLQVLTGNCGALLQVACNDDSCAARSSVTFAATAGTPYLIRVMGFAGGSGTFSLRVSGGGGTVPGACCNGSTCTLQPLAQCSGANRRFAGAGTTCNAPGNSVQPCCRADFNQSGAVTVQDVFDFLAAWFAADPAADFAGNGAGAPTVQSVFDFLTAWFSGGCS